ncbi:hypothetical protein [Streptacidiphilus carbonis]|uniref:hypothetical protein n=1 Tax=Streptacidiphilus carbonis TaxID=105422 RepID=UPI0005A8E9A4|nr:hypothetical protein [Streptacidiphilus carbonis]
MTSTPGTIARFLTLGGAHVVLTVAYDPQPNPCDHTPVYAWQCAGCTIRRRYSSHTDYADARDTANDHAGTCRSTPQPDTDH